MQCTTEVCCVFFFIREQRGSGLCSGRYGRRRAPSFHHDEVTLVLLVLIVYQIIQSYAHIFVYIYAYIYFFVCKLVHRIARDINS
jgi:hypothetical protein